MQIDSVSKEKLPFGVQATALETVAPDYLRGGRSASRFGGFRYKAGR